MAYFSCKNRWATWGEVMRTVDVAVQTIFPAHLRWTCLVWVIGEVGEAEAMWEGVGWDIISGWPRGTFEEADWRDVWE
jgi:hypothetical protein